MPRYLELDVLAQQQRINNLYTQITFCFESLESPNWKNDLQEVFQEAVKRVAASFPCVAGKVVQVSDHFKVESDQRGIPLIIRDYSQSRFHPTWSELEKANFPFHLLDESWLAPRQTFASSDVFEQSPHVFLVQANFVVGGLLLTFNGQHGAMDMAGLSATIGLFAKACRKESFTPDELAVGNMNRREIITVPPNLKLVRELLDTAESSPEHQASRQVGAGQSVPSFTSSLDWSYFAFSASSLSRLKMLAARALPANRFVSTDDVLTALIWQCVTRTVSSVLTQCTEATLSRNVDLRRYLDLPADYPGLATGTTTHTWGVEKLLSKSLGDVALHLRSALGKDALLQDFYTQLSRLQNGPQWTTRSRNGRDPGTIEVRLSSWAKEACCAMNFGDMLGEAAEVRRPRFVDGAREGLIYFLPKSKEGTIMVGVCLNSADLDALGKDQVFAQYANHVR